MKEQTKTILMIYSLVLLVAFFMGSYIGVIEFELVYNMTCDNGSVEIFNKNTSTVCGGDNPLHSDLYNQNYLNNESVFIT